MPFRNCEVCGAQFTTTKIHGPYKRRYCGDTCQKRAKRAQKKATTGP